MKKIILCLVALIVASQGLLAAPKAVVFDFGGVMTGEPNRQAVIDFIQESLHLSSAEFEKASRDKRSAVALGKTDEEFWVEFAEKKGVLLPDDWSGSFNSVLKNAIGVNPEMDALVDQLKASKMTVGMLSNIDKRLAALIAEFGFYTPFEPCLLSCDIGFEKPDPKIYQVLIAEMKLAPEEIIFIDDKEENISAAQAVGIDGILFESTDQIRRELISRGALQVISKGDRT